ncbi:UDP-N-acetylmuramoyl-tripeptide--D-alanyl-D-alanine ligase [Thauera propionica]|uniref:UDP-N-acetylmuramoyl-tripeptide--D-alanyl-D- alanine ligase n=1 Tax=Thauera propionica TaxID=2019431 RepID=UPI0023F09EA3|nr:UDP-N-acetylmuramoyl-tripeptide--D-alanyl-D-alanine ligase [Thauera propionica]
MIAKGLRSLARRVIKRSNVSIIAITGSVGKTTTKECVSMVLEQRHKVRKTFGNANDRTGVPATILSADRTIYNFSSLVLALPSIASRFLRGLEDCDHLVLEVGARNPGQIPKQLEAFTPDIAVVTSVGPAHLSTLGSIEGIAEEKGAIVSKLSPAGFAVLCADNPIVAQMAARHRGRSYTYGFSAGSTVWATEPVFDINGLTTTIHDETGSRELTFPNLSNRYHLYAVMAAWCVGLINNIPPSEMAKTVTRYSPVKGRGSSFIGARQSLIVDDAYNANPLSMEASLAAFDSLAGERRRLLVLGDMLELGPEAPLWHELTGKRAAEVGNILIAVGQHARHYANGFNSLPEGRSGKIFQCNSANEAMKIIDSILEDGDAVLIKGSHGSNLYRLARSMGSGH